MLDSSRMVRDYVAGGSREAFLKSSEKQDAVSMRLAVVGESARHISEDTAGKLPTIPFPAIRAMRHRIAHDYGRVDAKMRDHPKRSPRADPYLGKIPVAPFRTNLKSEI